VAGFLRYLRLAALVGLGLGVILAVWQLDRVLGTGRFLSGLGAGLVLGLAGVFASIAHLSRQAAKNVPLRQPPMPSEVAASYDWQVVALDGTAFRMEAARGEILFLNIWSTMCPPCVAELPSIERLHRAVGDDVRVMCIATDGDLDRVRKFVTARGLKLPVFVLADGDPPHVFDSDYIPATYVVNADGMVVYQHTGAALWDHRRVVAFLRGLAMKHVLPPPKSELDTRD
jgi:thiol-disulfide isomerase/thioredoxin